MHIVLPMRKDIVHVFSKPRWPYLDWVRVDRRGRKNEAQHWLDRVYAREEQLASGRAVFRLQVSQAADTQLEPGLVNLIGEGALAEYTWRFGGQWRIRVTRPDGNTLKEIVCDGMAIDTGDAVWDARFRTKSCSDEELENLFNAAICPFYTVAGHLLPLTHGFSQDVKWWEKPSPFVFDWNFGKRAEAGVGTVEIDIKCFGPFIVTEYRTWLGYQVGRWLPWGRMARATDKAWKEAASTAQKLILDITHDGMPLQWTMPECGSTVWNEPSEVLPGVFFPRIHYLVGPNPGNEVRLSSELLIERSAFNVEIPSEAFEMSIHSRKKRVPWPVREGENDR
ncbi:MAG: hypothetical protein HY706_00655 [Candidatus Hydrogenedentes bacterium]|nr:hypothetical protein [Candidatus Hydrogenedentota bacterium]